MAQEHQNAAASRAPGSTGSGGSWSPPELALRKFARRQASEDREINPPLRHTGRTNWLRLATSVFRGDWLLQELSEAAADRAIFRITLFAELDAPDLELDAIAEFLDSVIGLYVSGRCFVPEGTASFMALANLVPTDYRVNYEFRREPESQRINELRALLFAALATLLGVPNRQAKLAALHGFGHLCDARCRTFVAKLQQSTDDDEIREYSKDVLGFRVS